MLRLMLRYQIDDDEGLGPGGRGPSRVSEMRGGGPDGGVASLAADVRIDFDQLAVCTVVKYC
jgi:hypothetical protein